MLVETLPARVPPRGPSIPETYEEAAEIAAPGRPGAVEALESMAHAATLPAEEEVVLGTPHCQRCEIFPRIPMGPGVLRLSPPHSHTLGKVLTWLQHGPLPWERSAGVVAIEVPSGSLAPVLGPLVDILSPTERRHTAVVFQPAGHVLTETDYFNVLDLPTFSARVASGWLIDLMRRKRLRVAFQPIIAAGDQALLGYECLLRAEADDGRIIPAPMLFEAARRAELTFQLCQGARRAAIRAAAERKITSKIFINFSPNAIYDPKSCLDATVRIIDAVGIDREQVVFEVVESERIPDLGHLRNIMDYYRDKGFGVALDDIGAGYSTLQLLLGLRPDYVKLDMNLIRGVNADPAKAIVARKLIEAIQELGRCTIAEGIETKAEWDWIRARGVDYAQGYLIARPDFTPPTPKFID